MSHSTPRQTQAIHELQRQAETLGGILQDRDSPSVKRLHQNAQRLLRPLLVANPYAQHLTFGAGKTRMRRDHMKYLTLIRTVAYLHQYQRPIRVVEHHGQSLEYIEVTLDDIRVANELAHKVLGRTLDELPPQTRQLLLLIDEVVEKLAIERDVVRSDVRFSRRDVREYTNWGNTQLKVHMNRLAELEYLSCHRRGQGQSFIYELCYQRQGNDSEAFLPGLIDVDALSQQYDANRSGLQGERSGVGRQGGGIGSTQSKPSNNKALDAEKPSGRGDQKNTNEEADDGQRTVGASGGFSSAPVAAQANR